MKIDKQNGNVAFSEGTHTYWNVNDNTKKYISVTTLIERYGQPFDKEFWSVYKALQQLIPSEEWKTVGAYLRKTKKICKEELLSSYDISEEDFNKAQQDILDEWEKSNREACERGTKIHADIENSFYNAGKNVELKKFNIGGKFECRKNYTELDLPYGVYPEYLISRSSPDGVLNIAGQIDCLVKNGNEITIIDHKTNAKIDTKGFYDASKRSTTKMKYPLNKLDDTNFWHYTLQLSTYAWMLQKINPDFIIKDLILNHYDHDGNNTLYHCEYLKHEVELMLTHYKRQLEHEQRLLKYKRIEY